VGRAATAAAARPTRSPSATRGTNGRGGPAADHVAPGGMRASRRRLRARARNGSQRSRARRFAVPAAGLSAAVAVPVRVLNAPFARTLRARTAKVLDALLSGRGWIALIGVLLVGIVFFNVDLLQMNRDIAQNAEKASALKRANARLRLDLARLASSERIQQAAADLGLVLPAPGEVRYLKVRPGLDPRRAAKRITEPNPTLMPPAPVLTAPESILPPGTTLPTTPPAATTPPATTTPPTTLPDGTSAPQATAPAVDPTTGQAIAPTTGQAIAPTTGQAIAPTTGQAIAPTTGQATSPTTGGATAPTTVPTTPSTTIPTTP
jgi:cell division protein FtsL